MENEENLLPKPLTDLPLPEEQISATTAPSAQKPNVFKSKFFLGFVALSILIAFLIGGFALGKNASKPSPTSKAAQTATPTPSPTAADWKTYNATFDSFSVKYPPSLNIVEDKYNEKVFRVFIQNDKFQIVIHPDGLSGETSLEAYRKNVETVGANQFTSYEISGEDALKFHVTAKSEDEIQIITIHNGKAYLITASPSNTSNASSLDQILSTFKFTNSSSSTDTSTWKTFINTKVGFILKYPPRFPKPMLPSGETVKIVEATGTEDNADIIFGGKSDDSYALKIFPTQESLDQIIKNPSYIGYSDKIVVVKRLTVAGTEAIWSISVHPTVYPEDKSQHTLIFFKHLNYGFIFDTYNSNSENEINQILSTLKFTN